MCVGGKPVQVTYKDYAKIYWWQPPTKLKSKKTQDGLIAYCSLIS